MPSREVEVANPLGIHARPAARFVKTAAGFDAAVTVTRGKATIDGKSILGLLFLAVAKGTSITIRTSGPDAVAALEALTRLVGQGGDEQVATVESVGENAAEGPRESAGSRPLCEGAAPEGRE